MEQTLFSARWYRVAGLRPCLPAQVALKRQAQRGVPWYLLVDRATDEIRRLNRAAYRFVGRCDGSTTVQRIWDELLAAAPDEAMTQDELVDLLVALHGRGLLQFDIAPDIESIFRTREAAPKRRREGGVNPLAFRISLGNPARLVARGNALARRLFSPGGLALWAAIVLAGLLGAAMHARELAGEAARALASPGVLFIGWLIYPLIKAAHEAAHALAVQRWGGTVQRAGVTLLMLTPVPFVDASSADGFRDRHQRALVSAAGIMAELLIAALAFGVWAAVQPGAVRDAAFLAMFIGAVSTVLTNGNPLMRFDGYFLCCDLLDLRNLAPRSARWWAQRLGRHVLGIVPPQPLETLPGEAVWLALYAPLSCVYRVAVSIAVAAWVGHFSGALGLAVGGLSLAAIAGAPCLAVYRYLRHRMVRDAERARAWRRVVLAAGVLALLVAVLPLPFGTVAEGVVWLPERAQVRARSEGFIVALAAKDGQHVRAGELIAVLEDEPLRAERATQASALAESEVDLFRAMQEQPDLVPAVREKLEFARAELARLDDRIAQLEVRADADGLLVMPQQADMPGSFRKRGEMIAYLLTGDPPVVRVALPQQDAGLVRREARSGAAVKVRLAEAGHAEAAGRIALDMPGAVDRLPSAALGEPGGGRIATDPADKDGLTPRSGVVLVDVAVPGAPDARIGGRALVRFDHGLMPIAGQALRQLQQLVLHRFNPAV